jgi:heat shock protein HslJ
MGGMRMLAVCGAFLALGVACAKTAPTGSESTGAAMGASTTHTASGAATSGATNPDAASTAARTPASGMNAPPPPAAPAVGASSAGLTGTSWRVAGAASAAVSLSSVPTITFDKPEHVTGSTGCNRFSGSATWSGASLRFGALLTTRRACAESALMDQERRFLRAIEACRSWRRTTAAAGSSGGDLELLDEGGAVVLRLEAAPKTPGEE